MPYDDEYVTPNQTLLRSDKVGKVLLKNGEKSGWRLTIR